MTQSYHAVTFRVKRNIPKGPTDSGINSVCHGTDLTEAAENLPMAKSTACAEAEAAT